MKFFILLSFILTTLLGSSQGWTQVDIGNNILIKMPASPIIKQIDSARKSYGCLYGKCTFSILVSKVPLERLPKTHEDQQRILTGVLGITKAKQDTTFISEDKFEVGKISGMQVSKFSNEIQEFKAKSIIRAFFDNGMLYQMTCLYFEGEDKDCDEARQAFFNSLSRQ